MEINLSPEQKSETAETIATACRLLAYLGMVRETTGHVSARVGPNRMLIRCRGRQEAGLVFTQPEAVREVNFDGSELDQAEQYETPTELPIHGEIYRARPEVGAVIHAHPRASMICTIAKLELKPIYGAFDPASAALGAVGVPLFPRSALIREQTMAHQMIEVMGSKSVCLLYGHGIVATGRTVEEATLQAIRLETLASVTLEVAKARAEPTVVSAEDLAYFERLRESQNRKEQHHQKDVTNWLWRHYVKLLEVHEKGRR